MDYIYLLLQIGKSFHRPKRHLVLTQKRLEDSNKYNFKSKSNVKVHLNYSLQIVRTFTIVM